MMTRGHVRATDTESRIEPAFSQLDTSISHIMVVQRTKEVLEAFGLRTCTKGALQRRTRRREIWSATTWTVHFPFLMNQNLP